MRTGYAERLNPYTVQCRGFRVGVWQTEIVWEENLKGEIVTTNVQQEPSVIYVTESDSKGSGDEGGCGIYIVITKQIYINGGQQCNGRLRVHVCSLATPPLRSKSSAHPRSARTVVCYPLLSDWTVLR
jgi:hypothetical protein